MFRKLIVTSLLMMAATFPVAAQKAQSPPRPKITARIMAGVISRRLSKRPAVG